MTATETTDHILRILAEVTETDEVRSDLDLELYKLQILDSMMTVQVVAALEQEIGVVVSLASLDQKDWATPRLLIEDVLRRLAS